MKELEAINKMVDKDSKGVIFTNTIVELKKVKKGGQITFGIDAETFDSISKDLMSGEKPKYIALAMVADYEEIQEVMNEPNPKELTKTE